MRENIAIKVNKVSKTFKIPHEKISTVRGAFVNVLKKKTYEEFKALDNVSFEVKKGEFFGIIGRNGSGKSTLLKVLAGIYQTDKGSVKVNGLISPFLELGIGFNPELSGRDNIYLNAIVLGLTRKQVDEKFNDIVRFSELEKFIDQKLKNYSSGMSVRLAFSVAIHANRDILLMDEVLAVGDSNFQQKCFEEFNRYHDLGKTVILVSHDISTIQRYCDRAMLLRKGKIEMIGDPEKVGNKYIYQNMSDEEKRIFDEEKRIKEKTEKELEERKKEGKDQSGKKEAIEKAEGEKSLVAPDLAKPEKPKNKIAEITKVEFLDKGGNKKNVFRTGDDIIARIYYKARKKIRKPVFGVAINTQKGEQIAGPNTKTSHFNVEEIKGDGYVDFIITKNPFFSDIYKFTVAIYNWECVTPYDFKDGLYSFKIISNEENQYGLINLKHLWRKMR